MAADRLGLPDEALEPYGRYKAKIAPERLPGLADRPDGRLILVTAINPTPAGEGKTTTTIGLGDALNRIGKRTLVALREPSLGPCFGIKGGAAGGGYAQIGPLADINLHFTGDFHAITSANNLLAALIDNHLYWGNALGLDSRRLTWRRCMDMNDRSLRHTITALGPMNGFPRETGFDITVASEVMAIFCLATSLDDLKQRLGAIVIGQTFDRRLVRARDLKAEEAMTALLKDAFQPNLVQTLEGTPALVHGGPFANIAHGCNSVAATKLGLKLADYVITEAGFGADLGAEKFFDIKCRKAGLRPAAAVVVATVRALKFHGGVDKADLDAENLPALQRGMANLARHLQNIARFGVPALVAVNRFASDTPAELALVADGARALGVGAYVCTHWADGGAGAIGLAQAVVETAETGMADFRPLYSDDMPLLDKIHVVARDIYGAGELVAPKAVVDRLAEMEAQGFGHLPVCIAKTAYSFSADATLRGAPSGHAFPIREVRLSAGAGFVVAICGDVMTMPGLPRRPAAEQIQVAADGRITGLA